MLRGERIPDNEKAVFLFEPHAEWINKGEDGVPEELGLLVRIIEDQGRFILRHRVMLKSTDDQVDFAMVGETKQKFSKLRAVSIAKRFYCPANQEVLKARLECVVLPKKGRLAHAEKVRETEPEFVKLRKQHSAVKSAINVLEVHGFDKCPDHCLRRGFKRYIAMAVVALSIQRLGAVLRQQEQEVARRKRGFYKKAAWEKQTDQAARSNGELWPAG